MSKFDYIQHQLPNTIIQIDEVIAANNYSPETMERIKNTKEIVKSAIIAINNLDIFLDDKIGSESFRREFDDELKKLKLI
jgi:hypothetical protein